MSVQPFWSSNGFHHRRVCDMSVQPFWSSNGRNHSSVKTCLATTLVYKLKLGHWPNKFRPTHEVPSSPIGRPKHLKSRQVSWNLPKITRSKYYLPQSLLLCQTLNDSSDPILGFFPADVQQHTLKVFAAHNTHNSQHTHAHTHPHTRKPRGGYVTTLRI